MKKLFVVIAMAILSLVVSPRAMASEGISNLTGNNAVCKITSVWKESDYKLIGRCEGLVYPYQTQYEYYVVWAHITNRDANIRIGDIDRGYFEGAIADSFDKLLITAEQTSSPRRPSDKVVMEAGIEKFEFDKSESTPETTPSLSENSDEEVTTPKNEEVPAVDGEKSSIGSVIGKIVTAILTIILVIVALVIVSSLIFRRRGSVSK